MNTFTYQRAVMRSSVTLHQQSILLALSSWVGDASLKVWPTNEEICTRSKVSLSTLKRELPRLEKVGWFRRSGVLNRTFILCTPSQCHSDTGTHVQSAAVTLGGVSRGHSPIIIGDKKETKHMRLHTEHGSTSGRENLPRPDACPAQTQKTLSLQGQQREDLPESLTASVAHEPESAGRVFEGEVHGQLPQPPDTMTPKTAHCGPITHTTRRDNGGANDDAEQLPQEQPAEELRSIWAQVWGRAPLPAALERVERSVALSAVAALLAKRRGPKGVGHLGKVTGYVLTDLKQGRRATWEGWTLELLRRVDAGDDLAQVVKDAQESAQRREAHEQAQRIAQAARERQEAQRRAQQERMEKEGIVSRQDARRLLAELKASLNGGSYGPASDSFGIRSTPESRASASAALRSRRADVAALFGDDVADYPAQGEEVAA